MKACSYEIMIISSDDIPSQSLSVTNLCYSAICWIWKPFFWSSKLGFALYYHNMWVYHKADNSIKYYLLQRLLASLMNKVNTVSTVLIKVLTTNIKAKAIGKKQEQQFNNNIRSVKLFAGNKVVEPSDWFGQK